jgi:hypothetical protein
MSQIVNREEVRKYILRQLGACNMEVELSPEQVDDAINNALDQINTFVIKPVPRVEANRTGAVMIPLQPEDRGVVLVKCMLPDRYREYAQMNVFEILYRMVFPRMPLGDWYMLKSFYETYQKVRGTDPDWYEDESTKTLYVDCWSGPYDIFYVVSQDYTVEEFFALKGGLSRDFKKLAVAEAKIVLARIRGKYGGTIPVPGGQMMTDADVLRTEGESDRKEVTDRLIQMGRFQESPIIFT